MTACCGNSPMSMRPTLITTGRELAMKDTVKPSPKPRVLLELRPAFDGYAGIPQETRLLFRGLRMLESCEVAGMLQTSHRILAKGTPKDNTLLEALWLTEALKINRYSRVVLSAAERPYITVLDRLLEACERRLLSVRLTLQALVDLSSTKLWTFRGKYFEDFIWRALFAKSLPASDFELVTSARQLVCRLPWNTMHMAGLNTLMFRRQAKRSEEHTSELQSRLHLVCRLLLEKKKIHPNNACLVVYHSGLRPSERAPIDCVHLRRHYVAHTVPCQLVLSCDNPAGRYVISHAL